MNLWEFLGYRHFCPICDNRLSLYFRSKRKQTIRYDLPNKLIASFDLFAYSGFKEEEPYRVSYVIDMRSGDFHAEFFNKNWKLLDPVPLKIIERFKDFEENVGKYRFYRSCKKCGYMYESNLCKCDGSSSNLGNIEIMTESFKILRTQNDGTLKILKLLNIYDREISLIDYKKYLKKDLEDRNINIDELLNRGATTLAPVEPLTHDVIQTHLIKFITKEETFNRINKLLIFS
jgi:hypothetical protein